MKDDSLNLTLATKSKRPLLPVVAVRNLLPKQVVQLRKATERFVSKSVPSWHGTVESFILNTGNVRSRIPRNGPQGLSDEIVCRERQPIQKNTCKQKALRSPQSRQTVAANAICHKKSLLSSGATLLIQLPRTTAIERADPRRAAHYSINGQSMPLMQYHAMQALVKAEAHGEKVSDQATHPDGNLRHTKIPMAVSIESAHSFGERSLFKRASFFFLGFEASFSRIDPSQSGQKLPRRALPSSRFR